MNKWKIIVPLALAVIVAGIISVQVVHGENGSDSAMEAPMGTPPADNGNGQAPGGAPGDGGGSSSGVSNYTSVKSITSDTTLSNQTITSTGTDENAINISNGAVAALDNLIINRSSSDSTGGDNSSFYGVGAAILNTKGTTTVSNSTVTTDAKGGAGVFSYGDGITYVSDTTISTKQDTSGGIHAAGGGTLYAWNVKATTKGESSAAIRSDRGGGTMVVNGGTYTSKGTGSPAIYSTANIAVNNATLTSENSEAICIEGRNSIRLFNSALTGNMPENNQNDCTWNVILYQSMSGDSETGNSIFEMNEGSLTAKNGGMFYTTNTESTITLKNVDIKYTEGQEFFLKCTGNANQRGWGTTGSNGANCLFTGINQNMQGDIIWDSISDLDFYMTSGSTLTGAVTQDESCAGNGGSGYCNLYISDDSTWTVTADSTLTGLYNAGKIVDNNGKTVTIKGSNGTVYETGEGGITITVKSYSQTANLTKASSATNWSDYEVAQKSTSANTTTSTTSTTTPASTVPTANTTDTDSSDTSSNVTVKKTKIKTVERKKNNKSMKITLKKVSGVTGYQLQYSTKKKCTASTSKKVNSTSNTKTIKKLSAKKVYYVKARSYIIRNGITYYSKWTSISKIKRS